MKKSNKVLGKMIREARLNKGMTLKELGKHLRYELQMVWAIEQGSTSIPLNKISKLASVLDLSKPQIADILVEEFTEEVWKHL